MEQKLNHFDQKGNAVMVDVTEKAITKRVAVASGKIKVSPAVIRAVLEGTSQKGDVLGVARVAGIMAVKQTANLIPMCHTLLIQKCSVDFEVQEEKSEILARCIVKLEGKTGVEMEALTGVSVSLLTIYDMCKAIDKSMEITEIHLEEKTGGKTGTYIRNPLPKMKDSYGRIIDYLRISITDRCNLRCTYCMPEEGISCIRQEEILTYEEIQTICRLMAKLGLKHIKITGGEPLVRKECWKLIRQLKEIPSIETVTLTTNGILLAEMAEKLVEAGVDGVNISLDTLDEKEYSLITRGGDIKKVLKGLETILSYPQVTVKLNCVLRENGWEQTAVSVAELAKNYPVHVRFIEYMPTNNGQFKPMQLQDSVKHVLEATYGTAADLNTKEEKPLGFGPSVYYQLDGFEGKIGFISAVSHKFCESCNRLRLTADGTLRPCLQSKQSIDLKTLVHQGKEEELITAIQNAVRQKPKEHHLKKYGIETTSMSQIGG